LDLTIDLFFAVTDSLQDHYPVRACLLLSFLSFRICYFHTSAT
jgi:hypothetical protein